MSKRSILIVGNDNDKAKDSRTDLQTLLSGRGYSVESVASGDGAMGRLTAGYKPDAILLNIMPSGKDGITHLTAIQSTHPDLPVIILSGMGQIKTAIEAMRKGAAGYLTKPFDEGAFELAIANVFEKQRLREEVRSLKQQLAYVEQGHFLTSNPHMLRIVEISRHVANSDVPVLILGESGVGKQVLARFIHDQSIRANGPFVKVNCAALPDELLESELFGEEKGEGAFRDAPGKFDQADKGTLMLGEIDALSPHLQAKLLHVLQNSECSRLGGKRNVRVNVRILVATDRNLKEAVLKGEFRNDLYFRLNVITLDIPPLRERREDIPLLGSHFIEKYREKYQSSVQQLPRDLFNALIRYDWPGNVRQLENVIKRYLILPDAEILSELRMALAAEAIATPVSLSLKEVSCRAAEVAEKELVFRMLDETGWNRKECARRLNISYKALRNKLKKWQTARATLAPEPVRTLVRSA